MNFIAIFGENQKTNVALLWGVFFPGNCGGFLPDFQSKQNISMDIFGKCIRWARNLYVVSVRDDMGNTRLHNATNAEDVCSLLDAGANIEEHNWFGQTPLRLSVAAGKTDVVRSLLRAGADINPLKGRPLLSLSLYSNTKIMHLLLEHGANPWAPELDRIVKWEKKALKKKDRIITNAREWLPTLEQLCVWKIMRNPQKFADVVNGDMFPAALRSWYFKEQ